MAITVVGSISAGSTNGGDTVATGSLDTTGADCLVGVVTNYTGIGVPSISDSKSNSWTSLTNRNATNTNGRMFYCVPSSVGSGHTFSGGLAGTDYPSIAVIALAGVHATPFGAESGSGSDGVTTKQAGSLTPSENNCIVIACLSFNAANTPSINESFTIAQHIDFSSGQHFGVDLAYKIQTTAAAQNPTWTNGSSGEMVAALAWFKSAAGGGGGANYLTSKLSLLGVGI